MKSIPALAVAVALMACIGVPTFAARQSAPDAAPAVVFLDVRVSVGEGQRLHDLGIQHFDVLVDDRRRRVVQVQHVRPLTSSGTDEVIDRVSQYRVGIEPEAADYDGNVHQVMVRVESQGATWHVEAPSQIRLARAARPSASGGATAPRLATNAPTDTDVAAWERLWGGAAVIAAAERAAPRPTPAAPAPALETVTPRALTPAATARTAVDEMLDTYAAGDTGVVIRELRSLEDFERLRPDLVGTLSRWRAAWTPARAAFAMEVAVTAFARRWPNAETFLGAARDIVTSRPEAPGTRADHDAFEVAFHRAAVALLAAAHGAGAVDPYLTSIKPRVVIDANGKNGLLRDARLLMAHAMARDTETLARQLSAASRPDALRTWVVPNNDGRTRRELSQIAALYQAAETDPATQAEARVRRAFALHRIGSHETALALLESVEAADETVEYWHALVEGRVLVALGREPDAVAAFERAAMAAPDAQTPAVALMAIFLKAGDREQALGWAERARTTTENRGDPWPQYWTGQARFLAAWLADLREARP